MPDQRNQLPPRIELIHEFLTARGWSLRKEGSNFDLFVAPRTVGAGVELTLPSATKEKSDSSSSLLVRAVNTLSEIHGISRDQLALVLAVPDTVAAVRMEGRGILYGSIPIVQFEAVVERMRKALLHAAAFSITDEPLVGKAPGKAHAFVRACRFLQTEVGSFVAKVQIPNSIRLADPDLFREHAVESSAAETRLRELIGFVTKTVLDENENIFTEESLLSAIPVLNLELLRDIGELLARADSDEVNFTFLNAARHEEICSGRLTPTMHKRVTEYIAFAKQHLAGEFHIDVTGRVVELHARRKDRKRNFVGVSAVHKGREVFVALGLRASDYPDAIRAHAENTPFRVAGTVKRKRTQLRITKLDYYEVAESGL